VHFELRRGFLVGNPLYKITIHADVAAMLPGSVVLRTSVVSHPPPRSRGFEGSPLRACTRLDSLGFKLSRSRDKAKTYPSHIYHSRCARFECTESNSAIMFGVVGKASRSMKCGLAVRGMGRAKPKTD
jgi:hypothetical protein